MQKAKQYDWQDSNMALFGSDLEKNVKKASAETEEAWKGCGQKVGLEIWRINQFKVNNKLLTKNECRNLISPYSLLIIADKFEKTAAQGGWTAENFQLARSKSYYETPYGLSCTTTTQLCSVLNF